MARTWVYYKDKKYELDSYSIRTIREGEKEVRKFFAQYHGKEVVAKDLIELRGLLQKVFDEELKTK